MDTSSSHLSNGFLFSDTCMILFNDYLIMILILFTIFHPLEPQVMSQRVKFEQKSLSNYQLFPFKPDHCCPNALSITDIRSVGMVRKVGHVIFLLYWFVFNILVLCSLCVIEINENLSILVFEWTGAQSFITTMISLFANLDYMD